MSGGGNKTDPPVTAGPGSGADDGLLTAEDLFADLVDAPPPPGQAGRAARKEPIRVQVSDPVTPGPFAPVAPGEPAEDYPGDTPAAVSSRPSPVFRGSATGM